MATLKKQTDIIAALEIKKKQLQTAKEKGNKKAIALFTKQISELRKGIKEGKTVKDVTAKQLAASLLASRKKFLEMSKKDFNGVLRQLAKKPEYAFLKNYTREEVVRDIMRKAKPVGWRFKGRGDYRKPTPAQVRRGRANGTVYYENRPNRSDVSQTKQLAKGGKIKVGDVLQSTDKNLKGNEYIVRELYDKENGIWVVDVYTPNGRRTGGTNISEWQIGENYVKKSGSTYAKGGEIKKAILYISLEGDTDLLDEKYNSITQFGFDNIGEAKDYAKSNNIEIIKTEREGGLNAYGHQISTYSNGGNVSKEEIDYFVSEYGGSREQAEETLKRRKGRLTPEENDRLSELSRKNRNLGLTLTDSEEIEFDKLVHKYRGWDYEKSLGGYTYAKGGEIKYVVFQIKKPNGSWEDRKEWQSNYPYESELSKIEREFKQDLPSYKTRVIERGSTYARGGGVNETFAEWKKRNGLRVEKDGNLFVVIDKNGLKLMKAESKVDLAKMMKNVYMFAKNEGTSKEAMYAKGGSMKGMSLPYCIYVTNLNNPNENKELVAKVKREGDARLILSELNKSLHKDTPLVYTMSKKKYADGGFVPMSMAELERQRMSEYENYGGEGSEEELDDGVTRQYFEDEAYSYENGGEIDINDLDIPVHYTMFEDEMYEYGKGGNTDEPNKGVIVKEGRVYALKMYQGNKYVGSTHARLKRDLTAYAKKHEIKL